MFPFIGLGAFVLVSFASGLRLLGKGLASRDLPVALVGAALFFAGAVGPVLTTWAGIVEADGGDVRLLWGSGLFALCLGASALYAFTWRVFRPDSRASAVVVACGLLCLFGGLAGQTAVGGMSRVGLHDPWAFVSQLARSASFAWAAWASLSEYRAARRRVAVGLADPLVANRFLLWGVAAACAFSIFVLNLTRNLFGDYDPTSFFALTVVPALGLAAALTMTLAFFPPAPYARLIEGRSAGAPGALPAG